MKGKRIDKTDLTFALREFLRNKSALLIGFEHVSGAFKTKMFRGELEDICLFNPVFQFNTALYLRRIFLQDLNIVAILRPCETRAYVELTKLTQVEYTSIISGSVDCFGTISSKKENSSIPKELKDLKFFLEKSGDLRYACKTCRYKEGLFGDFGLRVDSEWNLWFIPYTERCRSLYDIIEKPESDIPSELERKKEENAPIFQTNMDQFRKDFERCIMCLNCRDMCPVCYCIDCLFNTDEYLPKGDALINTVLRSNTTEIPKNKEIYHLIRMYHVSQTCVGCGSCEEACPQNIPLTRYFKGVSERLSGLFDYVSGRSFEEKIPYTVFKEDELEDADD